MKKREKLRKKLRAIKSKMNKLLEEQQDYIRYQEIEDELFHLEMEAEDIMESLLKSKS